MAEGRILPPPVLWAQRKNLLYVKVQLEDCKNPIIRVEREKLYFRGRGGTENKEREVTLEFLKEIKPEDSQCCMKDRAIEFVLIKVVDGYWKRLLKEDKKFHWLKVDFDKWKDETESDEEAVDTDFEEMIRRVGTMENAAGAGLAAGFSSDGQPDSDDDVEIEFEDGGEMTDLE